MRRPSRALPGSGSATLGDWPETRILGAMRGWRRGCGPLGPWFRATPFAAANHYRDRSLSVGCPPQPPVVRRLVASLPRPAPGVLWIFDLPGPLGLWLGWELRRRWKWSAALAWNGWYDPHGVLDGRAEIALLLSLGQRLVRIGAGGGSCLLFDSKRHAGAAGPRAFDNRYTLNEEDAPSVEQLRTMGVRRVRAFCWERAAEDLRAYLDYLRSRLSVTLADGLSLTMDARTHG